MTRKKQHGGARKGAGRKKTTGDSPRKQIRITPDLQEGGLFSGADVKKAALWALAHDYKKGAGMKSLNGDPIESARELSNEMYNSLDKATLVSLVESLSGSTWDELCERSLETETLAIWLLESDGYSVVTDDVDGMVVAVKASF